MNSSRCLTCFPQRTTAADIAEASTRLLLDLLGWQGQIIHSNLLPARPGRSQRLADLAQVTGARSYLCGTGGMTYLTTDCFDAIEVHITPFRTPNSGIWTIGRINSALTPLMQIGFDRARDELLTIAAQHRGTTPTSGGEDAPLDADALSEPQPETARDRGQTAPCVPHGL